MFVLYDLLIFILFRVESQCIFKCYIMSCIEMIQKQYKTINFFLLDLLCMYKKTYCYVYILSKGSFVLIAGLTRIRYRRYIEKLGHEDRGRT